MTTRENTDMSGSGLMERVRQCAVKELEELVNVLEADDTCRGGLFTEPTAQPNFLGPKKSRYARDLHTVPLITFIPVLEIRPTANRKLLKETVPNVARILFPSPGTTHQYNTWNRPSKAKSIEIRCGQVYENCLCENYNGLQDKCTRSGCGTCLCLLPRPQCQPGKLRALQPPNADKQGLAKKAIKDSEREKRPYCCHPSPPPKWKDTDPCPLHG